MHRIRSEDPSLESRLDFYGMADSSDTDSFTAVSTATIIPVLAKDKKNTTRKS